MKGMVFMKNIKLFLVVGVIVALLSACGSSASSLVGRWEAVDKGVEVSYGRLSSLEFFSDGTYNSSSSHYSGSYSVEGNRMRISGIIASDYSFTFDVSGSTLTVYDDNGDAYEYSKVIN